MSDSSEKKLGRDKHSSSFSVSFMSLTPCVDLIMEPLLEVSVGEGTDESHAHSHPKKLKKRSLIVFKLSL